MKITELCHDLDRVRTRFGDLEVRAGSDIITRIAVLPLVAIEEKAEPSKLGLVVSLLCREEDAHRRMPGDSNPSNNPR